MNIKIDFVVEYASQKSSHSLELKSEERQVIFIEKTADGEAALSFGNVNGTLVVESMNSASNPPKVLVPWQTDVEFQFYAAKFKVKGVEKVTVESAPTPEVSTENEVMPLLVTDSVNPADLPKIDRVRNPITHVEEKKTEAPPLPPPPTLSMQSKSTLQPPPPPPPLKVVPSISQEKQPEPEKKQPEPEFSEDFFEAKMRSAFRNKLLKRFFVLVLLSTCFTAALTKWLLQSSSTQALKDTQDETARIISVQIQEKMKRDIILSTSVYSLETSGTANSAPSEYYDLEALKKIALALEKNDVLDIPQNMLDTQKPNWNPLVSMPGNKVLRNLFVYARTGGPTSKEIFDLHSRYLYTHMGKYTQPIGEEIVQEGSVYHVIRHSRSIDREFYVVTDVSLEGLGKELPNLDQVNESSGFSSRLLSYLAFVFLAFVALGFMFANEMTAAYYGSEEKEEASQFKKIA